MLLNPDQRAKLDETDDSLFYGYPRFVTHVDENFIQQLTSLYRARLKPHTRVLDLMSSWVSHLPPDLEFEHVEGHGLNSEELARNNRLDRYFVQDLNKNPKLPLPDQDFDAVLITVSVQYLQYPEAVFSEMLRVLKPGGIAIVSFSNRMFYQKAISAWRETSEPERVNLVKNYFAAVPGFTQPEAIANIPNTINFLQWLTASSNDPFYAVIAYREQL